MKLPLRLCAVQARFLNGTRVYFWGEHKAAAFHFKWRLAECPEDATDLRQFYAKAARQFGALARDHYTLLVEEYLANG